MRILHVNTARMWRGGERQTLLLMAGLKKRGHDVLLICPPGSPLAARARSDGVPVLEVRMRGELDLGASMRIASCVRRFRPDIVHLHTAHAHSLGLMAGLWTRMPARVVSRRVDFRPGSGPWSRLKYLWPGLTYAAVSENVRNVLVSAGVDEARVRTIHSGIPAGERRSTDGARLRAELGIPKGKAIVVSVAALAPHKDHATLLQAARRVVDAIPDVHFLLVGDGELAGRIRKKISTLGLERDVTMAGFRDDVDAILAEADVFASSSWLEGLGTSILDAMAAGLPVVATGSGGIPEMVRDGDEGRLVPVRSPDALADALISVLRSPDEMERMGRAAMERSVHFDIENTISATERMYRDLMRGRKH